MNANEIEHYELMEFLCSVIEHLDNYDGAMLNVPKKIAPEFSKVVHNSIGEIIFKLMCIDSLVNPELIEGAEGFIREAENEN